MEDLIRRSDAKEAVMWGNGLDGNVVDDICEKIDAIPSADTDLSEYSDKLWKNAYERGKADRPQGEWKINNNGWAYCSKCGRLGLESYDFCPNCGARMKGEDE